RIDIEEPLMTVRNHAAALTALSPKAEVLFDASFAPRLDYYTGGVFEMTGQRGDVLASGGEYDRLLDRLGATERVTASGCSLWHDRLDAEVIERASDRWAPPCRAGGASGRRRPASSANPAGRLPGRAVLDPMSARSRTSRRCRFAS